MSGRRTHQSGNIFFALFGAVALLGAIGVSTMAIMRGPVRSMAEVTKHTMAENSMIAAGRLSIVAAAQQVKPDCDDDTFVEPVPWDGPAGAAPAGGGNLPASVGASRTDPWKTGYGYCAWDHGTVIDAAACGGASQKRLRGENAEDKINIAVISAGPDRVFQTTCAGAPAYLTKPPGSDDMVLQYTYAESQGIAGGLWNLKEGDAKTAEIDRNLEVKNGSNNVVMAFDQTTDTSKPSLKVDFISKLTPAKKGVEFLSNIVLGNGWLSGDGDAEGIKIDNAGNVGIGKANPAAKLHVNGNMVGGIGANSTTGTLNWNDASNTVSGSPGTLLLGSATNGPGGGNYFHPFNFEYAAKDGSGQITQLAIPYADSTSISGGLYLRGRYSNSWTPWVKVISEDTSGVVNVRGPISSPAGTIRDANGGWVRTYNSTGWYNGTYGGGMYMTDADYVRVFNAKGLLVDTTSLNAVQGNSGSSYGVTGTSSTSVGVRAASTSSIGVYATSGSNYAVYAATSSAGYGGVIGYAANSIYGILGYNNAYSLYGNGQIYVSSTIQTGGSVYAYSFYHSSDLRLKKNITDIEDPFVLLGGIDGKRYRWKKDGKPAYGVIAQDVEKVMPEAVSKNPQGYLTVDYDQLIAPLVEAVKQLKADNDNLHEEIRLLKEGARD